MAPATFKPLTITPVSFSLTEGTNIPAPPDSPPPTPGRTRPGGGPLSSHPTTPSGMPGAFPPSPVEEEVDGQHKLETGMLSPAQSPTAPQKGSSSVRKLLSLRSLRGERNRNTQHGTPGSPLSSNGDLHSPGYPSRPGSPYTMSTIVSSDSSRPGTATRRRSSAWFGGRRKSGFFPINVGTLDEDKALGGAVQPPKGPPPPTIPEFREFKSLGEALAGGELGAEEMFKDIK